jgi:hypothetical protein
VVVVHLSKFPLSNLGIRGTIKMISTSKMMKIIAMRKNCMENGIRAKLKKLNPHSKGIIFSRILFLFFEIVRERDINIVVTISLVKVIIKRVII